jgi:hypothetical protein
MEGVFYPCLWRLIGDVSWHMHMPYVFMVAYGEKHPQSFSFFVSNRRPRAWWTVVGGGEKKLKSVILIERTIFPCTEKGLNTKYGPRITYHFLCITKVYYSI